MKRLLIFVLITIVTFGCLKGNIKANQETRLINQEKSLKEYNKLINNISEEDLGEDFGGCYIDDSGNLVVLITSENAIIVNKFKKLTENNSLKTKEVKYSYGHLKKVIDYLNENHEKLFNQGIEIYSVKDDVINNQVIVGLKSFDKEIEKELKKILKTDAIVLVLDDKLVSTEAYNVAGGTKISNSTLARSATLGFCASRQKYLGYGQYKTIYGFVTATHGKWSVGNNINISGNSDLFGKLELQVISGNCDATFVEKSSSLAVLTDDVSYTDIDSVHMSSLPVGTYVTAYAPNQGVNTGKILSTSASCTFDVGYAYDLVQCDYKAIPGDSGAPIMYGKQLLGIHKGGDTTEYFTKYNQIQGSLQCTPIFN